MQAMYEAVASGLGLAPGVHPLVEPYFASRRLVELTAFGRTPGGAHYLVATRRSLRSRKVAEVRDWLQREATFRRPSRMSGTDAGGPGSDGYETGRSTKGLRSRNLH